MFIHLYLLKLYSNKNRLESYYYFLSWQYRYNMLEVIAFKFSFIKGSSITRFAGQIVFILFYTFDKYE